MNKVDTNYYKLKVINFLPLKYKNKIIKHEKTFIYIFHITKFYNYQNTNRSISFGQHLFLPRTLSAQF